MRRWLLPLASVLLVGIPVHAAAVSIRSPAAPLHMTPPLLAVQHAAVQPSRGDTFDAVLRRQGIARAEIARWQRAARAIADVRRLQPGHVLQLDLDGAGRLLALRYELDGEERLAIERDGRGRPAARREPLPARLRTVGARVTVGRSIKDAALRAGIPDPVISQLVDLLSWRLDFKEDVHRGDRVRVLWEQRTALDGRLLKPGRIVAVEYEGCSDSAAAYLLVDGDEPTYIDEAGHPLNGAPLRYPLEFSRITSAFSDARMHPILHVNRPHLGIDFAAPTGTPVRAIGAGTVQFSGVQNGFGNHIEIGHGHGFVSAYSHLENIAAGITTGVAVARGQLIGWVGQTGLATGPHLHFATFEDGEYVDPLSIRYPAQADDAALADTAPLRRQLSARLRAIPLSSPSMPTAPELGLSALAVASGVGPITLTF